MADQPETPPKPPSSPPPVGQVDAFPQTIFISEKRGVEPAPPPEKR